jgi:kumamolisin
MTVAAAQRTFHTRLARFRDARGQTYVAPAGLVHGASAQPALPAALRGRVTGVVGLDTENLATPNLHAALTHGVPTRGALGGTEQAQAAAKQPPSAYHRTGTPSGCRAARATHAFTPNQYLTAYGYSTLHKANLRGQGERAALIEIDGFRGSDISNFARCFRLASPHISVVPTGGLRRALGPGGETTLDLELMTAAAPKLSRIYVYESRGSAGHVLRAYSAALARGRRPAVISASLGICEPLALATMGHSGINGIERILRTAAGAGVSVLASAGDQGSSSCVLLGHIQHRLALSYPASSPYVTGVGGTNIALNRSNRITGEIVWNDTYLVSDAGGGGYSVVFGHPAYQAGVSSGARVLPDVSMLADLAPGYAIYCTARDPECSKGWGGAGGTSAAAPLLAAGVALIDQDLRNHKSHAVGDLNPLLYLLAGSAVRPFVYNDVTAINNDIGPYIRGSNHRPLGCCAAAPGFDWASGWGSVRLDVLAHIVAPPKR